MTEEAVSALLQRVASDPDLAGLVLLAFGVCLVVWALAVVRGARADLRHLLEAIEAEMRTRRQEAAEHEEAALRKLDAIATRLGETLPPHVRVQSISAENLVVSAASDGKRVAPRRPRPRPAFDDHFHQHGFEEDRG